MGAKTPNQAKSILLIGNFQIDDFHTSGKPRRRPGDGHHAGRRFLLLGWCCWGPKVITLRTLGSLIVSANLPYLAAKLGFSFRVSATSNRRDDDVRISRHIILRDYQEPSPTSCCSSGKHQTLCAKNIQYRPPVVESRGNYSVLVDLVIIRQ